MIKEALLHWKRISSAKVTYLRKELPHNASNITLHLLSQRAVEEYVFHQLHKLRATMKTFFVDLHQYSPTPFIHCHHLMND